MTRYLVDTKSVAIYDTRTDEYAPYQTVGRASEDAAYLNEGIGSKNNVHWMPGTLYREALKIINLESEFDGNVPD